MNSLVIRKQRKAAVIKAYLSIRIREVTVLIQSQLINPFWRLESETYWKLLDNQEWLLQCRRSCRLARKNSFWAFSLARDLDLPKLPFSDGSSSMSWDFASDPFSEASSRASLILASFLQLPQNWRPCLWELSWAWIIPFPHLLPVQDYGCTIGQGFP